jgi:hypothetical protein
LLAPRLPLAECRSVEIQLALHLNVVWSSTRSCGRRSLEVRQARSDQEVW